MCKNQLNKRLKAQFLLVFDSSPSKSVREITFRFDSEGPNILGRTSVRGGPRGLKADVRRTCLREDRFL